MPEIPEIRNIPIEVIPIPIVKMPRWVFVLILGLLLNFIIVVFNVGQLTSRLTIIEMRFDRLEDRINVLIEHLLEKDRNK